jgi:hypothetical protein
MKLSIAYCRDLDYVVLNYLGGLQKMAKSSSTIELRYSLLSEEFTKAIGKKRTTDLKNAISKWTTDKAKKSADELTNLLIEALTTYWQKSKLKDFKKYEVTNVSDLIVDVVHRKGRPPNTIRLENIPKLKKELLKLAK